MVNWYERTTLVDWKHGNVDEIISTSRRTDLGRICLQSKLSGANPPKITIFHFFLCQSGQLGEGKGKGVHKKIRNVDEITSPTMYHSFRPPLPDLKLQTFWNSSLFLQFLWSEIEQIQPKSVCLLGEVNSSTFLIFNYDNFAEATALVLIALAASAFIR